MSEHDIHQRLSKIDNEVTQVKSDIMEIKTALLGDNFGNHGYGNRLKKVEERVKDIDKRSSAVGAASGAGSGGFVVAIIEGIKQLIG
jgi:mevalonate kinase